MRLGEVADPVLEMYLGIAAEKAGDFISGQRFLFRAVERLREQGRVAVLTQALVHLAWTATYLGNWASAAAAGIDGGRLARDSRQPQYGPAGELVAALATALRGVESDVEAMLAEPERRLLAMNGGPMLAPVHLARGAAALGDGRQVMRSVICGASLTRATRRFIGSCAGRRSLTWSRLGVTARTSHSSNRWSASSRRSRDISPPILCAGLTCARPLIAAGDEAERLFRRRSASTRVDIRSCVPGRCSPSVAGYADTAEVLSRANRCATRSIFSTLWARHVGVCARDRSFEQPAKRSGSGHRTRVTGLRLRSSRSPNSPPRASQTARSASGCSSLTALSARICTGSSPSSRSLREYSCATC